MLESVTGQLGETLEKLKESFLPDYEQGRLRIMKQQLETAIADLQKRLCQIKYERRIYYG